MKINRVTFGLICSIFLFGCQSNPAPSRHLNYQTKTELIFPVKGESLIAFGGRTTDKNHHATTPDQRFALDIVALMPGSRPPSTKDMQEFNIETFNGDKSINENYYCFGRELMSPADGTVVDVMDGIQDNIPGEVNRKQAPGNYVVIDHGNSEYSMMAHFKENSVRVIKGQRVKAGDVVGLIGNSGNSDEPHHHYHLQNTAKWFRGEGLPAQFTNYLANGKQVKRGEPVQGDVIAVP